MSNRAVAWAYARTGMKAGAKFVLVTLADMGDHDHSCYPGITELARLTGLSEAAVRANVKVLIEAGYTSRERRVKKDGTRTSNRYYLDPHGALGLRPHTETLAPESGDGSNDDQAAHLPPETSDGPQSDSGDGLAPESDIPTARIKRLVPSINFLNPQLTQRYLDAGAKEPDQATGTTPDAALAELLPPPPTFADFWIVWPRSEGKADAIKAWAKACRRADPAVIVAAATAYAASPYRPDRQFVPHGSTWLNGSRWEDPAPQPPEQRAAPPARHPAVQAGLDLVHHFAAQEAHDDTHPDRPALGPGRDPGPRRPHP